ncbi:hypothetical protein JW964_24000 [candidate division KSB1 bacterium]|nr:hypothetical protein [candidate division KSB1 bacterium]
MMVNACAIGPRVDLVVDLILVSTIQLTPQISRKIVGLDAMDSGPGQVLVMIFEVFLFDENQVCGVFSLHQAPMALRKFLNNGTILVRGVIEKPVNHLRLDRVGQFLDLLKIAAFHE